MGLSCRIHAAVFSFIAGVMPPMPMPMPMLGRSCGKSRAIVTFDISVLLGFAAPLNDLVQALNDAFRGQ